MLRFLNLFNFSRNHPLPIKFIHFRWQTVKKNSISAKKTRTIEATTHSDKRSESPFRQIARFFPFQETKWRAAGNPSAKYNRGLSTTSRPQAAPKETLGQDPDSAYLVNSYCRSCSFSSRLGLAASVVSLLFVDWTSEVARVAEKQLFGLIVADASRPSTCSQRSTKFLK